MSAKLYGIGVGVGDPEMLTLKAVKIIKESDIICLPKEEKSECRAFNIVEKTVPEINEKEILCFDFEMIKDKEILKTKHRAIFDGVKKFIEEGKNVTFLTIGDPNVYSTFSYIAELAKEENIEVKTVNGINSFCAAAAALGILLCEGEEQLHVIADTSDIEEALKLSGTKVIMKCARSMPYIKKCLSEYRDSIEVYAVSECGTANERCFYGIDELPDDSGYMMTIIVKDI